MSQVPGQVPEASIEQLLQRIKSGDLEARKELFTVLADEKRFGNDVRCMARKLLRCHPRVHHLVDTLDVMQSALRSGFRHLSKFRGSTEGELFGWLRAILRTKVNRVDRGIRRTIPLSEIPAKPLPVNGERGTPLDEFVDDEQVRALHRAVAALPLKRRIVVELSLQGLNSPQIAELLGLRDATVRQRLCRAVKELRSTVAVD
jgi:RNA polymerase sigma factor (sigma-70 family)